ncbi:TauD/TfdA family dioxygenase [uncultured Sphingomonas sp.]|uniref:TauD/TfdA dioxygenase family protein n=1 Tax=uncultured Sphingomonas sp. TaxID=158754 RepID=UPI0025DD08A8|nr:TauD/TfdA family dioxygenase [uncultured Sphingomonas sp.]
MSAQRMSNAADATNALDIAPVAGRIGGVVQGVKLAPDLDDETLGRVWRALCRHKVLFFRDQHHLDDAGHQAFGRRLGTPTTHPTAPAQVGDFLLELDSKHGGKSNVWHTDLTFVTSYPAASILRAVVIPAVGGDTVWANAAEAYARLPAPLRALADELWSIHSNDYDYAANQTERDAGTDAYQAEFIKTVYEAEHPLVRVHPETGERSLVLGAFFKKFVGLGESESRRMYEIFQTHITRLENTVRWSWRAGDVAIWDNRATQHYAIDDYGDQRRIVRRVTIHGEPPVAIDGRRSRQVKPDQAPEMKVAC